MTSGPGVSVFDAFNKELHEIINNDANVSDTVAFYDTYAPHFKVAGATIQERVINLSEIEFRGSRYENLLYSRIRIQQIYLPTAF